MKQLLPFLLLLGLSVNAQEEFTVYFDFNITEMDSPTGQKLSDWIAQNPMARIQKIQGYADRTGNDAYNQELSKKRAQYVLDKLKAANINVDYAEEASFGESKSTAEYNAPDRKVVIYYAKPAIQPTPVAPTPPVTPKESELTKQVSTAKVGDKIRLDNVNFHMNSDIVLDSSKPVLRELLKIMKENPKLKIQIQGHVCCMQETKTKISQKRAITVYNLLIKNGINKNRLSYTSFGSTKPIYPLPEKNEEERIANRRVEIEIVEN